MPEWLFEVATFPPGAYCATRLRGSPDDVPRLAGRVFPELRDFVHKHQIEAAGGWFAEGAQVVRYSREQSGDESRLLLEFGVACTKASRGFGKVFGVQYQQSDAVFADVRHEDVSAAWAASAAWASGRSLRPRGGVLEVVPDNLARESPVRLWLPVRRPPVVG
jgi:hypothetical protein